MEKNIMLAFVSTVSPMSLKEPILYPNIQGAPYTSIQTNESAIVYVERMLGEDSLEQIFLIASNAVKTKKVPTENEFGDVVHIEFLKRRLLKEFPYFDGKFFEIDYSDEIDELAGLEKNILQIAEIADTITNYAKNFPDCKLKVHADMTGGFRHTSMLMLSIIQLLKYRGIETGEILYSDPTHKIVYRANEIQQVSLLITGADEFVKFGSVNALEEYFEKNPSAAADNLLQAMRKFSDTIKLCRTAMIEDDLNELGTQIQIFRENSAKDLKSKLFEKIIATIEAEYGKLITGSATRFDIIRWCMRKDFWQQAMTLCTEWLPEEIVDRGIFKPSSQAVIDAAKTEGATFGRGWKQEFIIAYQNLNVNKFSVDEPTKEDLNTFCKNIRVMLELFTWGTINDIDDNIYCGDLKNFLNEYMEGYDSFCECCAGKINVNVLRNKFPLLVKALNILYDVRKKNPGYKKNFYQFIKTLNYEKIIVEFIGLPSVKLIKLCNIDKDKISRSPKKDTSDKPERKWLNREKIYIDMLDKSVAVSELRDRRKALDFLHEFYNLRTERNQINHATEKSTHETETLKNMIEGYLNKLEQI